MENTAFSTKIAMTNDMVAALKPSRRRAFLIFEDPKLRPPVLEEMMPDLQRVVASVAQNYCDSTSPHLQFDELMGEGNLKLAELITKGKLEDPKIPTRAHFFKYFKGSVNNHARSRVQRYRFTEKRTGQKPPPRDQRFPSKPVTTEEDQPEPEYHKNVDLSLDDPDLGIQIADAGHEGDQHEDEIEWGFSESAAEFAELLTKTEKLVYHEMICPSAHARCYAEMDAWRKAKDGKFAVKIKFSHMAQAIGLTEWFGYEKGVEIFQEAVLSIQNKINAYRMLSGEQLDTAARRNAIIAQLKQVFGLQIPTDIDDMVVRRMLTMAARDQFDKLNPQVNEMLEEVGAKVPRLVNENKLACYGVLYQKNCRPCNMCDLRNSCAVEAANIGLTKMVQSPRLLGTRQPRIPAFLPKTPEQAATPISSSDEAEIISHLDETFQRGVRDGQPCYYHYVGDEKKRRFIFVVERTSPLRLRFCNPSDALKKQLVGKQKTWFPRDDASLSEIIALIEQHGKETFE